jgi:hypothetical protein
MQLSLPGKVQTGIEVLQKVLSLILPTKKLKEQKRKSKTFTTNGMPTQ